MEREDQRGAARAKETGAREETDRTRVDGSTTRGPRAVGESTHSGTLRPATVGLGGALLCGLVLFALLPVLTVDAGGGLKKKQRGMASWYGPKFDGRVTASGEVYDMNALTAAHRSLPFGTVVRVRHLDNGRTVEVRINDRGPFKRGRILDLSREAARRLDMLGSGTARVELRVVARADQDAVWRLQLGAFRDGERAHRLAESLRDELGRELRRGLRVAVVGDGTWHKVQIHDYASRRKAEKAQRRLRRRGYSPLLVESGSG